MFDSRDLLSYNKTYDITTIEKRGRDYYLLRDDEFEPMVITSIGDFNKFYEDVINNKSIEDLVRKYISQSPFFILLKKFNPRKFRIAVNKFYVEIKNQNSIN